MNWLGKNMFEEFQGFPQRSGQCRGGGGGIRGVDNRGDSICRGGVKGGYLWHGRDIKNLQICKSYTNDTNRLEARFFIHFGTISLLCI